MKSRRIAEIRAFTGAREERLLTKAGVGKVVSPEDHRRYQPKLEDDDNGKVM
jgi:hypothetical protein